MDPLQWQPIGEGWKIGSDREISLKAWSKKVAFHKSGMPMCSSDVHAQLDLTEIPTHAWWHFSCVEFMGRVLGGWYRTRVSPDPFVFGNSSSPSLTISRTQMSFSKCQWEHPARMGRQSSFSPWDPHENLSYLTRDTEKWTTHVQRGQCWWHLGG